MYSHRPRIESMKTDIEMCIRDRPKPPFYCFSIFHNPEPPVVRVPAPYVQPLSPLMLNCIT